MLLADIPLPSDPWTACLQAGAFGLLTYIVVWMYPKSQREAREEREIREKHIEKLMETARQERREERDRFEGMVAEIHVQFNTRNDRIIAAVKDQTKELKEAFKIGSDSVCRSVNSTHHERKDDT